MELKINPEFIKIIPRMSPDEYYLLENSMVSENRCRDAILTWNGIIVDGHSRYEICRKHGIPFETVEMSFKNYQEALIWIINNQLGRRNLTDAARIELASHKMEYLRKQAQENQKIYNRRGGGIPAPEPVLVRKAIAEAAGVGVQRVRQFMKIKEAANPELLEQVMTGKVKIGTAFRALEMETTKVEDVIFNDLAETNQPYIKKAIFDNTIKIERMYKQMLDDPSPVDTSTRSAGIDRLLITQMQTLLGLMEAVE